MTPDEKLEAIKDLMERYEAWYEYTPEDSWRLERDVREVLGMPQVEWDY